MELALLLLQDKLRKRAALPGDKDFHVPNSDEGKRTRLSSKVGSYLLAEPGEENKCSDFFSLWLPASNHLLQ